MNYGLVIIRDETNFVETAAVPLCMAWAQNFRNTGKTVVSFAVLTCRGCFPVLATGRQNVAFLSAYCAASMC